MKSRKEREKKVAMLKKEREELIISTFRSSETINRSVVDVNEAYNEAVQMLDSVRYNFDIMEKFEASHSDLCQKYLKAKVDLEAKEEMINIVTHELERLEQDLQARRKRLKKEQNYLVTLSSVCFDECLQSIDCTGKLKLDCERGELSLVVHRKKQRVNFADEDDSSR